MRTNLYIVIFCSLLVGCAAFKPSGSKLTGEQVQTADEVKKELTALPVLTALPTPTSKVTFRDLYIVTKGDSLWMIAEKVYGDPFMWPSLSNGNSVATPDCIAIGQRIFYEKEINKDSGIFVDQAKHTPKYRRQPCR